HVSRPVREFLNNMFASCWKGPSLVPYLWPPRSPDINPFDFFLWDAVKEFMYTLCIQQIRNVEKLENMLDLH
ncbi:hypothetical protein WH47_09085, partial [Habropoda laboriosa]